MTETITPAFLKTLAFLAPATEDELRLLMPAAQVEQYPAGTSVFREGDHLSHIFIVTTGTVALEISGPDYRPRRIQTVGPGELLGWSPLLGTGAMTAGARATTQVRVVAIDAKALLEVCEADPRFGYQFMRRTAVAIAARLNATRLQLLDVYGTELPHAVVGGRR
ncbi:MAG: Crp/Fnr family transcriptional regulator [Planctomycetaceae bacterium]|nr:Crp/Fnr family transcriptional regulator [Planctomycetaceae bacterium]